MHWTPISSNNSVENSHLTPPLRVWKSRTENTPFPVQFEFTQICDMLMFRLSRWRGRQSLVENCFSLSAYYFQTNTLRGKCVPSSLCFLSENRKEEEQSCLAAIVILWLPTCTHLIRRWEKSGPISLVRKLFAVFVILEEKRVGSWVGQRRERVEFENKSFLGKGTVALPLHLTSSRASQHWPHPPTSQWESSLLPFSSLPLPFLFHLPPAVFSFLNPPPYTIFFSSAFWIFHIFLYVV